MMQHVTAAAGFPGCLVRLAPIRNAVQNASLCVRKNEEDSLMVGTLLAWLPCCLLRVVLYRCWMPLVCILAAANADASE